MTACHCFLIASPPGLWPLSGSCDMKGSPCYTLFVRFKGGVTKLAGAQDGEQWMTTMHHLDCRRRIDPFPCLFV
jgi:hypothetical protein